MTVDVRGDGKPIARLETDEYGIVRATLRRTQVYEIQVVMVGFGTAVKSIVIPPRGDLTIYIELARTDEEN